MDDDLRRRYAALVDLVEPSNSFLTIIKPLIEMTAAQNAVKLRPDATYFLLVNLSEMIMRAYSSDIPIPPVWWARGEVPGLLEKYKDFRPDTTAVRIEKALQIIIKKIPSATDPDGVSAHQVMNAIDLSWSELSELFAWG